MSAAGGTEITAAIEAEYDKKVMRVRCRANRSLAERLETNGSVRRHEKSKSRALSHDLQVGVHLCCL